VHDDTMRTTASSAASDRSRPSTILRDATASGIPLLDTTQIHAKAIVERAWRIES
jgi:hypothetical protein